MDNMYMCTVTKNHSNSVIYIEAVFIENDKYV